MGMLEGESPFISQCGMVEPYTGLLEERGRSMYTSPFTPITAPFHLFTVIIKRTYCSDLCKDINVSLLMVLPQNVLNYSLNTPMVRPALGTPEALLEARSFCKRMHSKVE